MKNRVLAICSLLVCVAMVLSAAGCAPKAPEATATAVPPTAAPKEAAAQPTAVPPTAVPPTAAPKEAAAQPTAAPTQAQPTAVPTISAAPVAPADMVKTGPFGGYEQPVKVTMMTFLRGWSEDQFKNSPWVKLLKDKFNIELEYTFLAPAGNTYDQGINLRVASGDLPDLMMVNIIQLHQMAEAGLLQPLTGVWEEYASDQAKEYMTAGGSFPFDVATINGELYAVPEVLPPMENVHALFINKQWIKDMGLPQPDTWENFEKILYAFRDNDPNGNGQKDEVPLALQQKFWADPYSPYEVASLANAFGEYPNAWIERDGQVVYGSVQPGMKDVLAKLAQYYKDGILDQEFIVKNVDETAKLIGEHRAGASFGVQWTVFHGNAGIPYWNNAKDVNQLCWDEKTGKAGWPLDPATCECAWEAVPIPSVNGKETKPVIYDKTANFLVVRKGYEHPEIAVKFANYMHFMGIGPQEKGPDGYPYLGISYADWQIAWNAWTSSPFRGETIHANVQRWDNWLKALASEQADTTWVESNYLARNTYHNWLEFYKNGPNMVDYATKQVSADTAASLFRYRPCGQTFMMAKDLKARDMLVWDRLGAYVTPTMVEQWATLQDLEMETFTQIITGQAPVDAFDNFVKQWYDLGGDQITKEVNEFVSSMK